MVDDATGPAGNGRLVSIDEDGFAFVERDGFGRHHRLHRGLRSGYLGSHPDDPSLMIVAFEGGAYHPERAERVLLTATSAEGLEALARDLLAAVKKHRTGRAIDTRFLV